MTKIYKIKTLLKQCNKNKNYSITLIYNYGKIMRCALFEILYLTEVYLVTD